MAFDAEALERRLTNLVDSRLFEYRRDALKLQMQKSGDGTIGWNGRVLGDLALKYLNAVTVVVIENYLAYCRDEAVHPAPKMKLAHDAIFRFRNEIDQDFERASETAAAFGGHAGDLRLFREFLDRWEDDSESSLEGIATGRLHGAVFYKHEHPVLKFIKAQVVPAAISAFFGGLAGWIAGGN